jgi:hypothetical protein
MLRHNTVVKNGRKLARQHAAYLMLVSCVHAAEHDGYHLGTPKMPDEPTRVQPSRNRELKGKTVAIEAGYFFT